MVLEVAEILIVNYLYKIIIFDMHNIFMRILLPTGIQKTKVKNVCPHKDQKLKKHTWKQLI